MILMHAEYQRMKSTKDNTNQKLYKTEEKEEEEGRIKMHGIFSF